NYFTKRRIWVFVDATQSRMPLQIYLKNNQYGENDPRLQTQVNNLQAQQIQPAVQYADAAPELHGPYGEASQQDHCLWIQDGQLNDLTIAQPATTPLF